MAHKKAGGSTANVRDSRGQRLGVKLFAGQFADSGSIIVRQRGSKFRPGNNVRMGKDYTLFAIAPGKVMFTEKHVTSFCGHRLPHMLVHVEPADTNKTKGSAEIQRDNTPVRKTL